jgi:hypothetical protein
MILKARVGKKSEKYFINAAEKSILKLFPVPRFREISRTQSLRIFLQAPQWLNQSLVLTRLAGARLAAQL